MTTTFVRVDPETLEIILKYNTNGGPVWSDGDIECTIPFDILSDVAVIVDDVITLQEDPEKVKTKNENQIVGNKTYRDLCLQKTDFTQLSDTGLTNVEEWATFRLTMRTLDLTPPVTWPVEPSSPWGPFLPPPPS